MTTRDDLERVGAEAVYEEPFTYCEKCGGIGSDENACFWCSVCKGQGYVTDEDSVEAAREYAELTAKAVLDALLAFRDADGNRMVILASELCPVREWNGGNPQPVLVWSCSHCGPCLTSRGSWCDLGCGSDYNRMTRVPVFVLRPPSGEPT